MAGHVSSARTAWQPKGSDLLGSVWSGLVQRAGAALGLRGLWRGARGGSPAGNVPEGLLYFLQLLGVLKKPSVCKQPSGPSMSPAPRPVPRGAVGRAKGAPLPSSGSCSVGQAS